MKRILITGKNSYIGNSLEKWLSQSVDHYKVDKISVRNDSWLKLDFSGYDSIVHVSGMVHKKASKENYQNFFKINRDLTYSIAKKAKDEHVKQFIFMSTMNVYGKSRGIITEDTPCEPRSAYGISKLEGEQLIKTLNDETFTVAIIRPPMVYGHDTPGNYSLLSKLAKRLPVFPDIPNQRSMIYIENLSEFIKLIIDYNKEGLFFPQNNVYVNTSNLVKEINKANGKTISINNLFNYLIKMFKRVSIFQKVFGSLVYDQKMSILYDSKGNKLEYNVVSFVESVRKSE